jgi:hypothetical protein
MKTHLCAPLIFFSSIIAFFSPVAAVSTGNATQGGVAAGPVQSSLVTSAPTIIHTIAQPTFEIPQNVGFIPIWLIVGVILIIIALSGLLWRYFHPKYVPKNNEED